MSVKNIQKILSFINENSKIVQSTDAELKIDDNIISFFSNGMPSSIIINYKGAPAIERLHSAYIKTQIGKNVIIINNVFRKPIPEKLLKFYGNLEILSCRVLTLSGNSFLATLTDNTLEAIIQKRRTNLEDETLVLYDTPPQKIERPFPRGLIKRNVNIKNLKSSSKTELKEQKENRKRNIDSSSIVELDVKIEPGKSDASVAPGEISQDIPKQTLADKIKEAGFAEGEKVPKDKGGY